MSGQTQSVAGPLTIAFYSPALPESGVSNGIVTYTRIMRDALRALGHQVLVFTSDHLERADGRIVELPKPSRIGGRVRLLFERGVKDGSSPWARLRVADAFAEVRRLSIDVIEIEETFGWAGRLAGRGVPIVERLHGPHVFGRDQEETGEEKIAGDDRERAELRSFGQVTAVTCPSQRLLDAIIERYQLNLRSARAIPNPVPVVPAGKAWNIGQANPHQILCVGRFDLRKGADIVVRAFDRAVQQLPSLKLLIAGPDRGVARPDGSLIHFDEFVANEVSPEARLRINFLGPQSAERIERLRLESGFAVVGSRFENFPYSIAEAMAAGMPVLASDSFGNTELVRDEVTGLIVPVGDIDAMARAMISMVSDPTALSRMGRAAYARAADWLSPDRIARESVEIYRQAIAALKV